MHAAETFELILALLGIVVGLYWLALKLRFPPSAALLVGGGAVAFVPGLPAVSLDPGLALVLFLPPLLVDGAYSTAMGRFRRQLPGILSLAVGAVVFTTLAVGVVVHWLMPSLPWAACFALGAIVSPPDAVSARAVLKGITLPRRLSALLEGESLLNDATGLVLFRFAVAAALGGAFSLGEALGQFLLVAIGGVVVGGVVGAAWVVVARRLGNQTLTVLISVTLGWTAYLAGEAVQVSGVIAAVTAGLMMGWFQHTVMSAAVRLVGTSFWRVMVFVLEAMVFMLIGFSLRGVIERIGGIEAIPPQLGVIVLAVIATLIVARFVWMFVGDAGLHLLCGLGVKKAKPLGWRQATVLSWAGMRGVVTLAVPLSLPANMPGRDLMLICAFAVIFVTVVLQGSSLGWLIRLVKPVDKDPAAELDMPATEAAIARARTECVRILAYANGELIHPQLLEQNEKRLEMTEKYAKNAEAAMERLRPHFDVMLRAIAASRTELVNLHRAGRIEDEVLHELERDLDIEEMGITFQRGDDEETFR
jgi:monovalent cation/hydrogen antiporter